MLLLHLLINIVNITAMSNRPPECSDIVSRAQWGARQAKSPTTMEQLVPYVVIHHTYQPGFCNTSEQCAADMRSMQRFHQVDRGWSDIGYNFAVGGDGKIYEGRGWGLVGAHAPRYNSRSIGIVFIGDYRSAVPTPAMLMAARRLIRCGVERRAVRSDYKLLGHRQVRVTECPGDALYRLIQSWPHWDPVIDIPQA